MTIKLKYGEISRERQFAYSAIDTERDYQDRLNSRTLEIGEEILLLEEYVARARKEWAGNFSSEVSTLDMIRKVAGIGVRCMEHHGAMHRPRPGEYSVVVDDPQLERGGDG